MPEINTHMAFANILNSELIENLENNYFLLGNIAPDCFLHKSNNYLDCKAHYKSSVNSSCQCELFLKDKCLDVTNEEKSFILGYYSHLWLDNYANENGHILTASVLVNGNNEEAKEKFLKNLLFYDNKIIDNKLNLEKINKTIFKDFKNYYMVSEKDMKMVFNKYVTILKESSKYSNFLVLKEKKYISFLTLASSKLSKIIRNI
ncbi:zinc dependent phospholipase C family protein [Clostridium sp. UBA6640]|uniref:zinc dependent phospholipase C family protein n=1 Tax=Clostridium sp. UBA6640 TaxID=1946370 RepID=UPI0025BCAD98|nr:zinc dependent phospholipase C family protein [Clostridium sp. UBA6640]